MTKSLINTLTILALIFSLQIISLSMSTAVFANGDGAVTIEEEKVSESIEEAMEPEEVEPQLKPDPKRAVCAVEWNGYYERDKIEISVSTRGQYNEVVVFFCAVCANVEHFVRPFLDSEYQNMTGLDRIRECGFKQAVFKGGRGMIEVVENVPEV